MNKNRSSMTEVIDWERYEKMTLAEKWAYLNEKTQEIDEKIRKILRRR